ncbi:sensor histidine kinase [Streptomyces sp. NPDC020802]|uniref:sensor histidine kinase n=1 Tax=Streptomyces sp. NPDC020802 TaxID=3365094 RepID=UPI00379B1231
MNAPSPPIEPPAARRGGVFGRQLRALMHDLSHPSHPPTPLLAQAHSRFVRRLPYQVALLFTAILLPVTVQVLSQDYGVNGGIAGALAAGQAAPLLLAVTRPLQAWWIVFTADVVGAIVLLTVPAGVIGDRSWPWTPMIVVGYLLLMLSLGLREPRRTLIAVWLVTGVAGLCFELVSQDRSDGIHVLLFVLSGMALLLGGALRERQEARQQLAEQETISETERERRTLLEERARIARELHDVVAHHMSVIAVQADSAPYRIDGLPPGAKEEFGSIAAAARSSLSEMRRLLGVLRNETTDGGELAPQPGLDDIPKLAEATERAGVPTEVHVTRAGYAFPHAVELSVYRIVQEALANVVRHAPGAVTRVLVGLDGEENLTVTVVNGPPPADSQPLENSGTGHGLVGLRERVRLLGGTLHTGPTADGFQVHARLPLDGLTKKETHSA